MYVRRCIYKIYYYVILQYLLYHMQMFAQAVQSRNVIVVFRFIRLQIEIGIVISADVLQLVSRNRAQMIILSAGRALMKRSIFILN